MKSRIFRPEFLNDEKLYECGEHALLLLLGMMSMSDRDGRLEDRPTRLKAVIFPYHSMEVCQIDDMLKMLHAHDFILRYEVDGVKCIEIKDFVELQKPHPKESKSKLPEPSVKCREISGKEMELNLISRKEIKSREKVSTSIGKDKSISKDKEESKKKKPLPATLPDELPPTVEAARLSLEKWLKWKESRREGYQKIGLDSLITKLAKFESRTIMDAIEDSISNGWKGLFPEKISRKNSAPFRETQHERNQRILRENHEKYSQPIGTLSTQVLFLSEDK